ncbi:MAG TPA: hypothetical protein VJO14_03180 [Bacteroidota bacterium]|nr:hypothetical protein [Bacteroidota bacterium]
MIATAVMAAALFLTAGLTGPTVPLHAIVFLGASASVIAAGRVADRLWDSMIAPALGFTSPPLCLVSRLPFRFLGGGIAFTTILLASKKAGLVPVNVIPVVHIFMTGGILSVSYYGFLEGFRGLKGQGGHGDRTDTGPHPEQRRGISDDKNRTA